MKNLEILLTVLSIVIGAASLLFAIFTAGIAAIAIFEWKGYKNYQEKRKESLIQGAKELSEIKEAKEDLLREVKATKDERDKENKMSPETSKKISDLENKIDNIIKKTEDKLSNIITSTPFSGGLGDTGWITGATTTSILGFGDKRCRKCGQTYYNHPASVTIDSGLCENCKLLYGHY